mgnify:CR=1 FL=1
MITIAWNASQRIVFSVCWALTNWTPLRQWMSANECGAKNTDHGIRKIWSQLYQPMDQSMTIACSHGLVAIQGCAVNYIRSGKALTQLPAGWVIGWLCPEHWPCKRSLSSGRTVSSGYHQWAHTGSHPSVGHDLLLWRSVNTVAQTEC